MSKETVDSWTAAFKPKFPLGYSQYQLNYIIGNAQEIQRLTVQLGMIWVNREAFKDDIDMAKVITNKVEEIKKSIGYLEGYLEPNNEEDGE